MLLQFPTLPEHMLRLNCRGGEKKKNPSSATEQRHALCLLKLLPPHGEVRCGHFFLSFAFEAHSLKWPNYNFVPVASRCLFLL